MESTTIATDKGLPMKIVTVVGARPQFIKAAVVSRQLRKRHQEVLVHTGQHYDDNMSGAFFRQLDIPDPDYNLGISGGTHAQMTGRMMMAVEEVLVGEQPDWLLVYGDTNSTLAAALAAAKLHVPVCHVEAGNRVHSMTNPEEINRICTDHVSSLLLACTQSAWDEMAGEGLLKRAAIVGDPMYDAFVSYSQRLAPGDISLELFDGSITSVPARFYYLTCHREENTGDDVTLAQVLDAMEQLDAPVIYPVHPRNRERAIRVTNEREFGNTLIVNPIGYLESTCLVRNAQKIITDSGGLQREAFFAEKKCVTVLDFVCWPETMVEGRNELAHPMADDILEKLGHPQHIDSTYHPFGDGKAAEHIVREMEKAYERR